MFTVITKQEYQVSELESALAEIRAELARVLAAVEGAPRITFTVGPVSEQEETA
jgi:hypothetical protein